MTEREWELLTKSIDEIKGDVKDVKKEMNTLKVRVAGFSSIVSSVITLLWGYFFKQGH